jgi:hypothetical protein
LLVEDELREIGVDASLDTDGDLVHRDQDRSALGCGRAGETVPVSSSDPLYTAG